MTPDDSPVRQDGDAQNGPTPEQVTVERYQSEFHAGPLPSPADLVAYSEISPDLVSRIIAAADEERAHRHRMDIEQSRRASWGLAAGFVVALMFLGVAAWLIINGHEVAGAILGSFDLAALTAVFVLGHRSGSP